MAKYSTGDVQSSGQTYSATDVATSSLPPKPSSWMDRAAMALAPPVKEQGDYGLPGVGMSREGLRREGERLSEAGGEVAAGARQVMTGEGAGRAMGASRMVRGAFGGAAPYVGGIAGVAAPLATAYSLPVGMAMDYATEKGLRAVGVPEGPAALASDVIGILSPIPGARAISRMSMPLPPRVRGVAGEARVGGSPTSNIGEPMGPALPPPRPAPQPPPLPPPPENFPALAQRRANAQLGSVTGGAPSGVFRGPQTPLQRALETEIGPLASTLPGGITGRPDMRRAIPPPMGPPSPFAAAVLPNRMRATEPPRAIPQRPSRRYSIEDVAVDAPAPAGRKEVVQNIEAQPPQRGPVAEPIDAGPVPKGVKSAAESAAILARENPPVFKSAKESAEVFARGEESIQREPLQPKPVQPEPAAPVQEKQAQSLLDDQAQSDGKDIFYLGSGLGALQPYYERFVAPHVKSAAAKVPIIRDMIAREMVDRYHDQSKFEKKAAGGALPFDQSVYAGMRLYSGVGGKVERRLNQVADALRPLNDEKLLDAAMKYGELERHEELGARLRDYKMPDGRTPADATAERLALEQQLGPEGLQKVQSGLAQYRAVMNDVLNEARDAGLISDASYQSIVKGNEKYIPFERVMDIADELGGLNAGQKAFSVASQDVVRKIKGSERQIANPIESSIRKLANTIDLIERNRVARKQADLANVPEFANDIKRLPSENRVPDTEKFSVLIDGKKVQYQAPAEVVAAMKHMDRKEADLMSRWLQSSAAMLRAGATELNPAFHVANVIRDYQTATLATQGAFTPMTWARGFAEAVKRGDLYKEFQAAGGSQSGVFLSKQSLPKTAKDLVRSKKAKALRTIVNPVQLMRTVGQTFELAPRLGVYGKSRGAGKSAPEAAFAARNATVDFSRAGNTMRVANLWVPFLNARLQGTLNQYKALGRDVKGAATGNAKKQSAAMLAYKLGMVAGLPLVATYLHNVQNFPKEWDSIDQQEKDKNFIFIFGSERDADGNLTQAAKFPKGEIQAMVGPTENFLEYMRNRDSKGFKRLAMEIGSNLSPVPFEDKGEFSGRKVGSTLIPPDFKAGAEWVTNKNIYTGRDIVPRNMEKATPSNQYDEKTPLVYRKVGELTGLSPKKLENTVGTKLGGAGRYAAEAADAAFGDTGAPIDTAAKMAKRFVGAYANAATQKDYEQLGVEDRAEADLRLSEERTAKAIINEIKALPAEQRAERFKRAIESGEASPKIVKRMVAELKGADKNRFDESLRVRPARERAQYIINNLKRLPPEQRAAKFQQFIDSKVLTGNVVQEMKAMMAAPPVPTGTY